MKIIRRLGRVILSLFIFLLVLIIGISIAIQIPAVQTKIAHFALEKLNKSLHTKMYVDNVDIDFFGKIYLNKVSIKDDHNLDFIKGKQLQTNLSIWSIIKNQDYINLKEIKLIEPNIQVITYKGDSVSNFIKFINKFSSDEPKDPNKTFKLDGDFLIKDGKASIINQNSGTTWLDAKNIQLHVKDFKLVDSDIKAQIANFTFDAKKNNEDYFVKNFTGFFHYSNKEIRIEKLNLKTDTSLLDGSLVLSYNSPEDMSDFNNKVFWDANFKKGSSINFKEIRYFTDLFNKNSKVDVTGKVTGSLNNLKFNDFELKSGDNYIGVTSLNLRKMMDGELSINTQNLKATTSYDNLTKLLPSFINQKIPNYINRFGTINYKGDLFLDPKTIVINGYGITALGDADIKTTLFNYTNPKNLIYKGYVDVKNLNIEQITEVKQLGYVNGRLLFDGESTDINNMNLKLDGKINYLDLLGKRYQNIVVDGLIKDYSFNGLLEVNDPNLNAKVNGKINFSGKPYVFNFNANTNQINLDFLGVTNNLNAVAKGDIIGDFSLTNLNDLKGNFSISNFYYKSKNDTLTLEKINFNSLIQGNEKNIVLDVPNYVQANMDGQFKLTELPDIFNNALAKLIPSFNQKKISANQHFNFNLVVEENLIKYFDSSIKIDPDTQIQGYINTENEVLDVQLKTTGLAYNNIELFKSNVNLNTEKEANNFNGDIDSLKINNFTLREINIKSKPSKDSLQLQTNFKIGIEDPVVFNLNFYHTLSSKKENYIFGISPSTIDINNTIWNINPRNEIESNRMIFNPNKKSFMIQNFILESDNQHLDLSGVFYSKDNFNFDANLNNLLLDKIIPKTLIGNLQIEGIANGSVNVVRTKEKLEPTLKTDITDLTINSYLLGNLFTTGGYNVEDKIFNFDTSLQKQGIESLKVNGDILSKETGPELDIYANFDDFNIDMLEGFLGAVFSNIRGKISGDARIDGPVTLPNLEGNLVAKDVGLKVDFLGVDYLFEGENDLYLSKYGKGQGSIQLNDIKIKDTAYNTKGNVYGAILFKNLSDWGLNLQFETNNLLVMNTTIKENELFYGRIFAKGDVLMMGPVDQLGIFGNATVVGNSELTINTGSTTIESENNLVRFVPDQSNDKDNIERRLRGMMIDFSISAYPNSKINLVFDAKTNDRASARGTAENLRFVMNNSGLSLEGIYNIQSGVYEFRQIPLIPKDFRVGKGSFVQFSGNPMNAVLNINAIYERSVSNIGTYLGIGQGQVYDAELSINISETLAKPKMEFGISLPKAGSDINSQLQSKIGSNPEEEMLQFSYILLTGKFGEAVNVSSQVTSTAADIGLSTIAGMLSSIINGVSVDLEYIGGSQLSNTNDKLRYSLSYQINDRLKVSGAYGMALKNQYVENFDGNFELSYDISKGNNGSLVLNAFTKPTTFGIQQLSSNNMMNQSYGGGINFNTSFDNFKELFKRDKSKKKEKKKKEELPAIDNTTEEENIEYKKIEDKIESNDSSFTKENVTTFNNVKPRSSTQKRGLVRIK